MKPPNANPDANGCSLHPVVLRRVDFEIVVPPIESGQTEQRKTITVEVRVEEGVEILTPDATTRIETIKMQMMISRMWSAIQKLNGFAFREAERILDPALGIDRTASAVNVTTAPEAGHNSPKKRRTPRSSMNMSEVFLPLYCDDCGKKRSRWAAGPGRDNSGQPRERCNCNCTGQWVSHWAHFSRRAKWHNDKIRDPAT